MAILITHRLELDVVPGVVEPVIHVSQQDTGRKVVIELLENGGKYVPSSGTTAKLEGRIAGADYSQNISLNSNKVEFVINAVMTLETGRKRLKIVLSNGGSDIATWLCAD